MEIKCFLSKNLSYDYARIQSYCIINNNKKERLVTCYLKAILK